MTLRTLLTVSALLFLPVTPAGAWTVSGQVTDQFGAPIPGCDLDFQDRGTGVILVTPGDLTDANGNYSVSVPTANYRIFFKGPTNWIYFEDKKDQTINANRTVDMELVKGLRISGFVRDPNGTGLPGVDLNFYEVVSGANMAYTGDNTDLNGFYSVLVDLNLTFDILYRPTPPDPHVSAEVLAVPAGTSSFSRPDVVLGAGFTVSGIVNRQVGGTAVFNADLDAENAATGETITLGYDLTDALGNYQLVLPAGTWNLVAAAPAGSGLAANILAGFVVAAAVTAPTISLPPGVTLSGTVLQTGGLPLANANLDVDSPTTGIEFPTTGDHTNAAGAYSVVVGAGTYNLVYWPPSGAPLAAAVLRNHVVTTSATLPVVTLNTGFVVSGFMRNQAGVPVVGADLNAEQPADGFVYPTLDDNSGPTGAYSVRVPAGTYRFVARPPAGSSIEPATIEMTITGNTTIDFTLFDPFATGVPEGTPTLPLRVGVPFPNPTSGPCRVAFNIPVDEPLDGELAVYDLAGRRIRSLERGLLPAGDTLSRWDGRDDSGHPVASGVYFINLRVGRSSASSRIQVVR